MASEQENAQEMYDRVRMMAIDNGMTWDLSDNDQRALQHVCDEIERLRQWLEGIHDFADRTMPHAVGQGHIALMSIKSAASKALDGEDETEYRYRNSEGGGNAK